MLKQLSIFIENKFGKLSSIIEMLSEINVDIRALSLADTAEYGVLRLVVSDHQKAKDMLKAAGITVKTAHVIAVEMDDKVGALAKLLSLLSENNVGIEYMYAFMGKQNNKAFTVIRADDNDKAIEVFNANGVKMLESIESCE